MSPYVIPGLDDASEDMYSRIIARSFGVRVEDIKSDSRKAEYCVARHLGMYVMLLKGYSTTQAGRAYGRSHSMAIAARENIRNIIETKNQRFYPAIRRVLNNCLINKNI